MLRDSSWQPHQAWPLQLPSSSFSALRALVLRWLNQATLLSGLVSDALKSPVRQHQPSALASDIRSASHITSDANLYVPHQGSHCTCLTARYSVDLWPRHGGNGRGYCARSYIYLCIGFFPNASLELRPLGEDTATRSYMILCTSDLCRGSSGSGACPCQCF